MLSVDLLCTRGCCQQRRIFFWQLYIHSSVNKVFDLIQDLSCDDHPYPDTVISYHQRPELSTRHTTAFITQSRFVSPKTFMCKRLHLKAVHQRPRHRHKSAVYVGGHQARAQAAGSHLLRHQLGPPHSSPQPSLCPDCLYCGPMFEV